MLSLADYPFLDVVWSMLVFFLWVAWFWLLFSIWGDLFRRRDLSGWGKTGWLIFTLVVPFLGVFVYVVTKDDGMTQRNLERAKAQREQMDEYVRTTALEDLRTALAHVQRAEPAEAGAAMRRHIAAIGAALERPPVT